MKKFDSVKLGFLLGLIAPILGAFFFYVFLIDKSDFGTFSKAMKNPLILSPLIRLGAVPNLLLFFSFIWTKRDHSARGVLTATFIYGGLAIYLTYSAKNFY